MTKQPWIMAECNYLRHSLYHIYYNNIANTAMNCHNAIYVRYNCISAHDRENIQVNCDTVTSQHHIQYLLPVLLHGWMN